MAHPKIPQAVALALLVTSCGPGPVAPEPRQDEIEQRFAQLINEHRRANGCTEDLQWSDPLEDVARRHSKDMATQGYFAHVSPEGRSLGDRLSTGGVGFRYAGENIAAGQDTYEQAFTSWLNSPTHRKNLERCGWRVHALGVHRDPESPYKVYWTHLFLIP